MQCRVFIGALLEMSILITLKSSDENEGLKIAGWFFVFVFFPQLDVILYCFESWALRCLQH